MNIKWLFSFNIQIWMGLKEQYSGTTHSIDEVYEIIQKHSDTVGDCVTVSPTRYIYKNGWEDGIVVGWIRYPRFPMNPFKMTKKGLRLAEELTLHFKQYRVSVVTPFKTYMLCNNDPSIKK